MLIRLVLEFELGLTESGMSEEALFNIQCFSIGQIEFGVKGIALGTRCLLAGDETKISGVYIVNERD